jgi:hypothetical protein
MLTALSLPMTAAKAYRPASRPNRQPSRHLQSLLRRLKRSPSSGAREPARERGRRPARLAQPGPGRHCARTSKHWEVDSGEDPLFEQNVDPLNMGGMCEDRQRSEFLCEGIRT